MLTGRRTPAPRAPRARRVAGLALSLVAVLGVATSLQPTSSAWADPAVFAATVTAGTWVAGDTCEVRNADGSLDPSRTCAVVFGKSSYWGKHGSGKGNASVDLRAGSISNTQYFTFSFALRGAPSWWVWSGGAITGGNGFGTLTSSCAALPSLTGRTTPNRGANVNVYVAFDEVRGSGPALCT